MSTSAEPIVPADEEQRLAAVRRYNILDTPPDGAFDRVAALAARFFGTPVATVTIVDEDRIWFKAAHGLHGVAEIDRNPGLCASAIMDGEPYVVTDALTDPRTVGNPLVHGEMGVRFYAAAPITTADGYRLGTVNVLGTEARKITGEEAAVLQDLAAMVMDQLELRLSAMGALRLERRLREQTEAERQRVQDIATTLQQTLLPPELPHVPGLDVAAYYHTALSENVGGDFYDLFQLADGRYAFFLGDVCGKGVPAAALTSLARHTLRAGAIHHATPAEALQALNSAILLDSDVHDARYCTVIYGEVEPTPSGARIRLARGGHPPAMLLRADGKVERLTPPGTLVGALPDVQFSTASVSLRPGDALVLYTDGLTEAPVGPSDRYGEDRLAAWLSDAAGRPAPTLVSRLRDLVDSFDPAPDDDVALLVLSIPAA